MSRWKHFVGCLGGAMLISGVVILVRDAHRFSGWVDWLLGPALTFFGAVSYLWWSLERVLGVSRREASRRKGSMKRAA